MSRIGPMKPMGHIGQMGQAQQGRAWKSAMEVPNVQMREGEIFERETFLRIAPESMRR